MPSQQSTQGHSTAEHTGKEREERREFLKDAHRRAHGGFYQCSNIQKVKGKVKGKGGEEPLRRRFA